MKITKHLQNLKLPLKEFVVVSSGALAIRGIRDANDIDVIVIPSLWNKLSRKYTVEQNEFGIERIKLQNNIEILNPKQSIFGNSQVVPSKDIFKEADVFYGIKFINLIHLKKIKLKLGREKDIRDVELIEKYQKIQRARELIYTSRHISIATVNEDGSPHNSPVRFLYNPKLEYLYWGSHPESMHSRNITRTGQIFVALYDRIESGGVYIKAVSAHEVKGKELEEALKIHNTFRIKEGSIPLKLSYYKNDSPQRMWKAKITNFWVNYAERGADGHLIKDSRIEITAKDLLPLRV